MLWVLTFLVDKYNRIFNYTEFNYTNFNYTNFNYNKFNKVLEFIPKISDKIRKQTFKNESLKNEIIHFCENQSKTKYIVSLSGGVDSMVLITIMHYLRYDVIGAHINYNNRDETLEEQNFLEEWCAYNDIKLYIKSINNIKRANSKRSDYEIVTKNMRLDFYKEIIEKENAELVLLAHHKDDIVENIFANVCRGRYILDLAVIKEKSIIGNIAIGRPMIKFYKKVIYEFAETYQIPYFKDTTPDWSVRGKYRKQIYPVIEDAFTTNVKNNLIGLSNQSYEWNELIKQEIIQPFMNKVNRTIEQYKNYVEFNVENYIKYPLCFWNVVFMNLFNEFGYSCPSRKGIMNFMNCINKDSNICYRQVSISNNCTCYIKHYNVKMEFKSYNNICTQ